MDLLTVRVEGGEYVHLQCIAMLLPQAGVSYWPAELKGARESGPEGLHVFIGVCRPKVKTTIGKAGKALPVG